MTEAWYEIDEAEQLYSPALVLYRDRLEANLRRLLAIAGGPERLRPHVKTHKMARVIELQREAGINKFKVATFAEAEMVASCGPSDILLAYPLVGPNVRRFAELLRAYPDCQFRAVADDPTPVGALNAALEVAGLRAEVLVDLDVGMHRTGLPPSDYAMELYRQVASCSCLSPGGLHVYDGQIIAADPAERARQSAEVFRPVEVLRQRLVDAGMPVPRVVCGGSPTLLHHAGHPDRELSPGTVLFWDSGYQSRMPDLGFVPSVAVLTRVISKPSVASLVTSPHSASTGLVCLDLGYKAVASENPTRVVLPEVPDAKIVQHSEEHLVIETELAQKLPIGRTLYALPWHICPTVPLYDKAHIVENGRIVEEWPVTARNRVLTV